MDNKNIQISFRKGMTKRSFVLMVVLFFLTFTGNAQEKKMITGTILDNTGVPLIGATILESQTSNGTVTDFDGKFELLVSVGSSIKVSYMGYITETVQITVSVNSPINITLQEDAFALDAVEIVAIGYGTMRKSDLTGAISTISSEDLVKGTVTSTEQVLQGKIAGLVVTQDTGDPSSGSSLRLRGGTSLTASNSPLIVVDGIAGVDINIVQPSDIQSIDILKDASTTAIYGSRGANGVIIITTKSTKRGLSFNYDGFTGVSYASNHLDMLSADQWRAYVRENGLTDAIDFGGDTNWQKELERAPALTQSHSINLASGNENGGLRASVSYLKNEGTVKTTG